MAELEKILGNNKPVMEQKDLIRKAIRLNKEIEDDFYKKVYPTLSEGVKFTRMIKFISILSQNISMIN